MDEKEFLEQIGQDGKGMDEEKAVSVSIFNALVAATQLMLKIENEFEITMQTMKLLLGEKEEGEDKNGK